MTESSESGARKKLFRNRLTDCGCMSYNQTGQQTDAEGSERFMLPEMRYIEGELLPMLRERAAKHEKSARRQLSQWKGGKGVCSLLLHVTDAPEMMRLPVYDNEEIHYDAEKMFVSQLRAALSSALADGDAVPSVRANVGCGALCTLYGGLKQTFFPDKMPWLLMHLPEDELRGLTEECIAESAEFKMGLEEMKYMKEMLKGTGIGLYPMDLQGPVDMAHLLMGDEFFYALYDDPDLVHHVMRLATALDIYGMEKCLEIIQPTDYVCHYNNLVIPAATPLKVSEDTSTLLSREHIEEFMLPYTKQLLNHFGGGYIHYCGDNKHLLDIVPHIENNIGLNFGNPERHDPASVLKTLASINKCYYGIFRRNVGDEIVEYTVAEQVRLSKREDGAFNSFMHVSCKRDEQQRIMDEAAEAML